jgi:N-glycosidase YbiA
MFSGIVYPHVEHAYQAAKTLDRDVRLEFASPTLESWEAKKMGNELKLRPDWEEIKLTVMEILVRQKFLNSEYLERLLLTGHWYIEEGNYWHDQFWGNCTCKKHIHEPGDNHLGKILMQIRSEMGHFLMIYTQKEAIEARAKYHC